MKVLEGKLVAGKGKFAIVGARFNEFIVSKLVSGAQDALRGSTSHYELVCSETAKGIAQVGLQTGVPVTFGVITTENIEQAIERAGTKAGNKGADAAMAALELVNLLPQI